MTPFKTKDKLVIFLYLLMRNNVPPGIIESLIGKDSLSPNFGDAETVLTNGFLAQYAEDVANRLRA